MSSNRALPDYELDDVRVVTGTPQLRAMFHPLRSTLLELLLERAATVAELAAATKRPPSTIAYHVNVLGDAGLLTVVRTRRVRGVIERSYGRTARIFYVGQVADQVVTTTNTLADAAMESAPAHEQDRMRAVHRHARIPHSRAAEFWEAVMELAQDFSASRRRGDTTYAFVAALYPAEFPSLPEPTA